MKWFLDFLTLCGVVLSYEGITSVFVVNPIFIVRYLLLSMFDFLSSERLLLSKCYFHLFYSRTTNSKKWGLAMTLRADQHLILRDDGNGSAVDGVAVAAAICCCGWKRSLDLRILLIL